MGKAAAARGRRFQPFFRVIRTAKSICSANSMTRYVAFGSKDLEGKEKGCFDRDYDHADVSSFVRRLPDHLTRHNAAPKAFHCVFSLPRDQFEECGLDNWRQVVRDVMRTYEQETNRRLQWIAANHDNPTHPHCHVIIKGVYENGDGVRKKLWLSKADLRQFRQITGRHLSYQRAQHRAPDRASARTPAPAKGVLRSYGTFLQVLQNMIQEERRRRRQQEREHQRWLRDEEERER